MYKITYLYFMFYFITYQVSSAQINIGLQTGLSNNHLNTNISNRALSNINNIIGYSVGVPIRYNINDFLFIQASPNITQKNYSINRTDSLLGVYAQNNNTYLQMPLSIGFLYGKRLQVFINVGAYIGYWISGIEKGKIPNIFSVTTTGTGQQTEIFQLTTYNQNYAFNSQKDNRFEMGWLTGGGLQYKLKKKYSLVLESIYYQSLTDKQKYMTNQIPQQYNQTFTFSIGSLYSF